jgi:dUTP pyrophosphatase
VKIKIKYLHPDAKKPIYATLGAMCFDLQAVAIDKTVMICANAPAVIRTGLSFEIPPGYGMFIFSRSGHGFKSDTRLSNCVGVIDSDYRGEVMVKLTCDRARSSLVVSNGDRIAQAVIIKYDQVEFEESYDLSETERGAGGFGSTG